MTRAARRWAVRLTAAAEDDFQEILRILHDAMDLQRHLPSADERA